LDLLKLARTFIDRGPETHMGVGLRIRAELSSAAQTALNLQRGLFLLEVCSISRCRIVKSKFGSSRVSSQGSRAN